MIGAGLLIWIILLISYFLFFRNNTHNDVKPVLPILSSEEKEIIDFSKFYIEFYNTYEFGDYSNMSSLGAGYSLPDMQNRLSARFLDLQENTPEGYKMKTVVNESDVSIKKHDASFAEISAIGESTIVSGLKSSPEKVKINVTLSIYKVNNKWMVFAMDQN